mmetsp:Transcript_23765/g.33951  ORF Transcript_23765/g.33951 Transcript_23765/m.33951 type:complete len:326 (+) Transcript_23765:88-1065(+)|eukprot:CAMPEP_0201687930 /NCGR_PEP_ID=MMETSP0578-20130828/1762_1 /ASSEMBLY_ACC=CAM_ASM_000663 /TAXON_ID=267565 /ORGANISM="Skeletonema grethea, Strain CCMP 1804" /LENGTH=325 /DNA_ID=CAMNT_0048172111 /DNA_START=55 /DNA_END=1032 /DNA_ORIENTATION=-
MTLRRVVCVTLVAAAANLSQDVSGFGVNRPQIHHRAAHSSSTAIRAEPTASEKAAELRKKAEEAKRKAEELRKVAEEKAAKAMMAVKEAQSKGATNGTTAPTASAAAAEPEKPKTPTPPRVVKKVDTPITVAKAASSSTKGPDPRDGAIVPVNQANIEFASGVLAGGLALAMGATPVFAVVVAAVANYISKKSDLGELNEFVNGISAASLNTVNWFAKLDSKYVVLGKLSDQLDAQITKLKNSEGESAETIRKIEQSLANTSKQIADLAEEIDLIEGSKQALGAVGEVIETSVDKAVDANKQYKFTERAANVAKKAVDKTKQPKE